MKSPHIPAPREVLRSLGFRVLVPFVLTAALLAGCEGDSNEPQDAQPAAATTTTTQEVQPVQDAQWIIAQTAAALSCHITNVESSSQIATGNEVNPIDMFPRIKVPLSVEIEDNVPGSGKLGPYKMYGDNMHVRYDIGDAHEVPGVFVPSSSKTEGTINVGTETLGHRTAHVFHYVEGAGDGDTVNMRVDCGSFELDVSSGLVTVGALSPADPANDVTLFS